MLFGAAAVPHDTVCAPLVRLLAAAPAVSAVTSTALMARMRAHGTVLQTSCVCFGQACKLFFSCSVPILALQLSAMPDCCLC